MAVVVKYYIKRPVGVNDEAISMSKKSASTGRSIKEVECIRILFPPRWGMTRCPQQRVFCICKSFWRRASNQISPVSALDVATDPESADRRISEGKLTPPPLSDQPLLLSNDTEPPMAVPKAKYKTLPLPPVEGPAGIWCLPELTCVILLTSYINSMLEYQFSSKNIQSSK